MIMELSDAYVTAKDDITNQISNLSKSHNEVQHIFLPANDDAMLEYDNFSRLHFEEPKEFIFDRVYVRVLFITLYSIVFCCCFFGNLLVMLVVTLSRRLRSITNFFLANLAVADFCVGIFCVFQNLSIYLIPSWVFGEFLCKMYQFVHSLSGTASIFILVVICTERYFAIIHPIKCKQILTTNRLRFVIAIVWILAAAYSTPRFLFVNTIEVPVGNESEIICISNRKMYNSELFDIINFGLLYVTPLLIMSLLYSRIAISLWKSSTSFGRSLPLRNTTSNNNAQTYDKRILGPTKSQVSMDSDKNYVSNQRNYQMVEQNAAQSLQSQHTGGKSNFSRVASSHKNNNVLKARRGVVKMLIVVVLAFGLCNLPLHARKMWQYWSNDYKGDSNFYALFTPLTFLITYFNSGVNPLLYAFLSRNFRRGMSELLCSIKKGKSSSRLQRNRSHKNSLTTHTNTTFIQL